MATTTTSTAPPNIVNSTEYSDLNLKPTKASMFAAPCAPPTTFSSQQQTPRHQHLSTKKHKNKCESNIEDDDDDNENEMPSPIPFMSPLKKKKTIFTNEDSGDENNNNNNSNKRTLQKKSSISDSDYKTQSSDDHDVHSLCNDHGEKQREEHEEIFDSDAHLSACEQMLNLEERFIELMQKGVQQYSRPLRHCMMISSMQHHDMFQNIEKILAISEYQLNQLISQDDSTLLDMFGTIGKLYENKMRMSCEAFDIYLNGIRKSFQLLVSLADESSSATNFAKFLSESQEDIDMDLRTFLLLPLYYVGDIYESLKVLQEKTQPDTNDYVCLGNLLSSLEVYVKKAAVILDEYNNGQSKNPLRLALLKKDLDVAPVEENCVENDDRIYATSLIHYRQSSHKWKKLQIVLLSDKILLVSRHTNAKEVINVSSSYLNTSKVQFKSICLKNILDINFSLANECEFQINYLKSNDVTCIHSVRLRTSSLEEKLNWNTIFSKSLSQLNFEKSLVNNIV